MRKRKLVILAIAILLQLHVGAGYLFAQTTQTNRIALGPQEAKTEPITRQETLRGSMTPEREWWDVLHYHLQVEFLPATRRLKGSNTITFKTLKPGKKMQIDLQPPLQITKIIHVGTQPTARERNRETSESKAGASSGSNAASHHMEGDRTSSGGNKDSQLKTQRELKFEREGNVYWVTFEKEIPQGVEEKIEIFYEGVPTVSRNPPWLAG